MRLLITDPARIVADHADVASIRAEDASGSFGIMSGHADFLTALEISVIAWRHEDGRPGFCAVRHGILTVSSGRETAVATREAHVGDDLDQLEQVVLAGYRAHVEDERISRTAAARLRTQAIRQIVSALRFGDSGAGDLRP